MTTLEYSSDQSRQVTRTVPVSKGKIVVDWLTTTDHKTLGYMYLMTSFAFFCIGGVMALIIRAELFFEPGMQFLQTKEQYNQLFTMHGTIMLLMFATPLFVGFANAIMPLQIGAPDVAFPRMNALSYWLFTFGSIVVMLGFLTPQGAASFGWFAYAPLSDTTYSPGVGGDLWVFGLFLTGFGTIMGGVNFITTIICLRAPGMTMWRMPIFTWNTLITSILVLMAFPPLAAALAGLGFDRRLGGNIFDPESGGAILWQHLFWFFGHPEVYIIALPFFGIVSEIFPVFSRKPIFGYKGLVYATIAIAALSVTVWAHHMYVTGAVMLPFFSLMTMLIAVPTGVKFFNWIGTMWRGSLTFETPMLWSLGFLVTFLFGGLTGVILASPPLNFQVSDTVLRGRPLPLRGLRYCGVRHVRRVLLLVAEVDRQDAQRAAGQNQLLDAVHRLPRHLHDPALAGSHGNAPALRRLHGRGRVHCDESVLHRVLHAAGRLTDPVLLERLNHLTARARASSSTTHGASEAPWSGPPACPPPAHNFHSLPRIRSERPALDLHHPELSERHSLQESGGYDLRPS